MATIPQALAARRAANAFPPASTQSERVNALVSIHDARATLEALPPPAIAGQLAGLGADDFDDIARVTICARNNYPKTFASL